MCLLWSSVFHFIEPPAPSFVTAVCPGIARHSGVEKKTNSFVCPCVRLYLSEWSATSNYRCYANMYIYCKFTLSHLLTNHGCLAYEPVWDHRPPFSMSPWALGCPLLCMWAPRLRLPERPCRPMILRWWCQAVLFPQNSKCRCQMYVHKQNTKDISISVARQIVEIWTKIEKQMAGNIQLA